MPKATTLFQTVDAAGRVTFEFAGRIITDLLNVRGNFYGSSSNTLYETITDRVTGVETAERSINFIEVDDRSKPPRAAQRLVKFDELHDDTKGIFARFVSFVQYGDWGQRSYASVQAKESAGTLYERIILDSSGNSDFALNAKADQQRPYLQTQGATPKRSTTYVGAAMYFPAGSNFGGVTVNHYWNTTSVVGICALENSPGLLVPPSLQSGNRTANSVNFGAVRSGDNTNAASYYCDIIIWEY